MHRRRICSVLDSRFEITNGPFNKKQTSCVNHCLLAECCDFLRTQSGCCCPCKKLLNYGLLVAPNPDLSVSLLRPFLIKLCLHLHKRISPCSLIQNLVQLVYSPVYAKHCYQYTRGCFPRNALSFPLTHSNSAQPQRSHLCPVSSKTTSNLVDLLSKLHHQRNNIGFHQSVGEYLLAGNSGALPFVDVHTRKDLVLDPNKLKQGCWIKTTTLQDMISWLITATNQMTMHRH